MAKEAWFEVGGERLRLSPDRVVFPDVGITKLDLARYYVQVAGVALRGVAWRPLVLKRFPKGLEQKPFYQKRAPATRPSTVRTVRWRYPSGGVADEAVIHDVLGLLWLVQIGCIDLNPHPVRADDLEHPDELRIDLDPVPGVPFSEVREVALVAGDVLSEHGLTSWPKTSGSRGMHLLVRIARNWPFDDVRRAALAVAREVERRMPGRATARWWKEEREGVFVDYNQNARDRTTASAWSVRPVPDARVSMPLRWEEVPGCDPARFTVRTAPGRLEAEGDPHEGLEEAVGRLDGLLELADALDAEEPPRPSRPKVPVITIARSGDELSAREGLERWKARHPRVVPHLRARDVLVDRMRGRSSEWTRIRVNLENVPVDLRPAPEPAEPDDAPDPSGVARNGVEDAP